MFGNSNIDTIFVLLLNVITGMQAGYIKDLG